MGITRVSIVVTWLMGAGISISPIASMLYPLGQGFHSGGGIILARPALWALQNKTNIT